MSSPAKACGHETGGTLGRLAVYFLAMGTAGVNMFALFSSASARNVAEQKFPASDEKDTIKKELRAGTIAYGISCAAGFFVILLGMFLQDKVIEDCSNSRAFVAAFASLAMATSAVGMGVNGDAYHTAQAFFSDYQFNTMLGTSIAGLGLNAISAALLTYYSIRYPVNPTDPVNPV